MFEALNDVARDKTGQQRGQETARNAGDIALRKPGKVGAVHRQHAARKAHGQAGPVGNRHGDVSGQNGQHVAKRRVAHSLKERRDRGVHAEIGWVDGVIIQQKRQRDHNAAAHHKGQHVGNAVHQVFVNGVADGIVGAGRTGRLCAALGMEDGGFAVGDGLDEVFRLVDAVVDAGKNHRLTVKTGGLDVLIRRNNDTVAGGDLLSCQYVFRAVGAVGLYFGGQAQTVASLGKRFGGHIGVGDAVRAGGHGQHAVALLRNLLLSEAFLAKLRIFLRVNGRQKLSGRFGGAQLFDKIVVHQHLHHAGQHVNVQAAVFRRGDGKQQVGLAVVLGVVLHGRGQAHRGQAGAGHAGGAGVRYRDAVVHVGGRLGLAGVESFFVGLAVSDVAVGGLQFHQPVKDLRLIGSSFIQGNGLRGKQFRNTHRGSPSLCFVCDNICWRHLNGSPWRGVSPQCGEMSRSDRGARARKRWPRSGLRGGPLARTQIVSNSSLIFSFVASPTLNAVALPQAVPRRSA